MDGFTAYERRYLEFLRRRFREYRGYHDDPIMDDPDIRLAVNTFAPHDIAREIPELAYNRSLRD